MSSGDLIMTMKSNDRSVSQQRVSETIEQTIPENPQTFGRFEMESSSRPSSDMEKKDDEDSLKLLYETAMSLEYESKEDKSEKEEPRVYSGPINVKEIMHEVITERLESNMGNRSMYSVEPVLQNPNQDSDSSQSSRVSQSKKRRSINVKETSRKKRKIVCGLDVEPIQTSPPEWLLNVMRREENGYNPKLISTRKLYKTDLDETQARLSVPFKQVKNPDFLTEEETTDIHENAMKTREEGVSVDLVDPEMRKHVLDLRKWKMSGNWYYVLCKGWKNVLDANRNSFKVDKVFPLWSFRSGTGKLCFALVPSQAPNSSHGSGNSLTGSDGASTSGECGQVPLPVTPPASDSSHSSQGCSGESSSRSS